MPTPPDPNRALRMRIAAAVASLLLEDAHTRAVAARSGDPTSPWANADGWRLGHAGQRRLVLDDSGAEHVLVAHGTAGRYLIETSDDAEPQTCRVEGATLADGALFARFDGKAERFAIDHDGRNGHESRDCDSMRLDLHDGERRWRYRRMPAYRPATVDARSASDRVLAPMPGRIVLVKAQVGDRVEQDQDVLVMEAMKMELSLKAPGAGVIAEIRVAVGDFVEADAALVVLTP